jgi:prevent-host-death family protein
VTKNKLSEFIDKAIKGEEVILSRYNIPVAKIVPIDRPAKKNKTVLGRSAHEGKIIGDLSGPCIPEENWNMLRDDFDPT